MPDRAAATAPSVVVENLGGISRCDVDLGDEVTVVTGPNASNKTSFLRAIAGALGGSAPSLKADADSGSVTLELDGETARRSYERREDTLVTAGEPYVEDEELVDRFVTQLASNPLRRAVEHGGDLRDLLLAPVDPEEIRADIEAVRADREAVRQQLSTLEDLAGELPDLEARRSELTAEREELADRIEALEAALAADARSEEGSERAALTERFEEARRDLAEVTDRIDRERRSLEAVRDERADLARELDAIESDEAALEAVTGDLERLQERRRTLEAFISDLATIVSFNEDILDGSAVSKLAGDDATIAPALDPGSETLECWTCGSRVDRAGVDRRIDELRDLLADTREQRRDLEDRLGELRDRRDEVGAAVERRGTLERRIDELSIDIERRESRIAELRDEASALRETVADLEEDLAGEDDLVERTEALSEHEYERGRVERELAEVRERIAGIERRLEDRDRLERREAELSDRLERLRGRIDDLEREVLEGFNAHVADLFDMLEYGTIERVRLERVPGDGTDEGIDPRSSFRLTVARSTDDGAVIEDDPSTLSESEREVVGLAVALAGYLAHEVDRTVPVMVLDSLDAIEGERIAALLSYLSKHVPWLVVGLLPADAAAVEDLATVVETDALE